MKRYVAVVTVLISGLLICFMPGVSLSQEVKTGAKPEAAAPEAAAPEAAAPAAQPAIGEEELEYSWGKVSSITSDQIVVKEYDYDSDTETDVTYTIDPKVTVKNIAALKDIKVGESVSIDYLVVDGKNIAKVITVEKPTEPEEPAAPAEE